MGQYTWKYVATQQPQTVTLYHGDNTGHVLITLNNKILIIDFKVRETKSYSFFIDEELCEINITRSNDKSTYTFEINKTVQTPLNVKRKEREKKHLWQTAGFFGLMIFVILLIIISLQWNKERNTKITDYGGEVVAIISLSDKGNNYTYEIDGLFYENDLLELPNIVNDFPLETNDEFIVKYSKYKPEKHQFTFDVPTEIQIERYTNRAIKKQAELSPQNSKEHAVCLVKIGFELKGRASLADFYFQDKSEKENYKHNENTFNRLIRSVEFKQKAEDCLQY
ncbi:MAG: hypothetical protein ACI85O_002358 [Saprospiraceae bacterium]|jgi:hypothetical protein